jgi:hypothetical protein
MWTAISVFASLALPAVTFGLPESQSRPPTCPNLKGLFATVSCPTWQVKASPPAPGHKPWTHAPACTRAPATGNQLCVYTKADFYIGVSLVATPKIAKRILSAGLLATSPLPKTFRQKYEAVHVPGKGTGLFVKPGRKIKARETILLDYPTLILPSEFLGPFHPKTLRQLQWMAALQLPDIARTRTRTMAKSMGRFMDEIENVMTTNSFYSEKAMSVA